MQLAKDFPNQSFSKCNVKSLGPNTESKNRHAFKMINFCAT